MPDRSRRSTIQSRLQLMVLLLSFVAAIGLAPSAALAAEPQLHVVAVDTSNYPAVMVTVEALGTDGLPITALNQSAFTVYEEGRDQSLDSVGALKTTQTPLTVVLALDTSLSMADAGKLQQAKQAATAFVAQMRPIDRVALIAFDSQLSLRSPLTGDTGALMAQINGLSAQGNTRIYDALYLALQQVPDAAGSVAIVLMTDGRDTESAIDLPHALALVQSRGIPVYTIGIGNDVDAQVLGQIASEEGGRYYSAPTAGDIGYAFRLMSDQLRNRYEVTYTSATDAPRGTRVGVQLTAQTPQGLATAQTSYVTPAILAPTSSGTLAQQPQVQSTAIMSARAAYIVSALAALGVLLLAGGLALLHVQRTRHARLAFFVGDGGEEPAEERRSLLGEAAVGISRLIAAVITRLLPPAQVQRISRDLAHAGNPYGWRVGQFVIAKFLMCGIGLIVAVTYIARSGSVARGVVLMFGLSFLGYRLPTFWLKRRIKLRQNEILRSLPDALDLLTICVEAGQGLDGAMLEVVNRWDNALSDEFSIVLAELKMGRSRKDALRSLADRTGLPEVTAFTSAMIQADELGMGIARPLALQATQLRVKRKQRAEKLAHEAGIKMIVAMGIFIMPALFMIILSPAVVQIQAMFSGH